jgi:ABC-2 type transport system ATP-binding protein
MLHRTVRRSPLTAFALAAAVAVLPLAACSSDGWEPTTRAGTATTTTTGGTATGSGHTCDRPTEDPPTVAAVADAPADRTMTSFDGTTIRLHWFPAPGATAARPAPTVLMGPGWGLAGDTNTTKNAIFGALGIGQLNDDGYNVLTWDPRGFGRSSGVATVDAPDVEGRDVEAMLDWIATQPEAATDRPGDPRAGMVGFSYGGGIQLAVATIDCRVDALVPGIAWHSLGTSLYKGDIVKSGWVGILMQTADRVDPHVTSANDSGLRDGRISQADQDWFLARGPGRNIAKVTTPTLFVQGTVDTLFTLDEAVTNQASLVERGVPTAMVWFCGGHGACLTADGRTDFVDRATSAWLDRYLKDDTTADAGAPFQFVDQHDTLWSADAYPAADAHLDATGTGTLALQPTGGSGPLQNAPGALGFLVADIVPTRATNAVDVTLTPTAGVMALGAPEVTLTYRGTVPDGDAPTRVFAQLVDDSTGHVLGNQITPIEVTLDGADHTTTVPLETIAHRLEPGTTITLQLVATTTAYALPRLGGSVTFSAIDVRLPLVTHGLTETPDP